MTGKIALLDLDIVAVSASAAAEERWYSARGQRFKTKKEMKAALGDVPEDEVERIVEPAPFSHARQNARGLVQKILDSVAPIKDYRGYLTGENNFRYKIATIKPYKGNRDRSEEPTWRKDVEEWLLSEYPTERTEGHEADDKLAVEATKDIHNSVICSLDKDFLQIPFLRMYRWDKDEHVHVKDVTEAARNFYRQLLQGDPTDNIVGVPGCGKAGAEKAVGKLVDPKVMMTVVYSMYQKAYGKDAWKALEENARLIFLCRTEAHLADPMNAWRPIICP